MTITEYELILILRPDIDEAVTTEILDKVEAVVTDNGGTLLVRDDWGVRKMAYEIQRLTKGRYVLEKFIATSDSILELERKIRIEERIIRFLTVRKPGAVDIEVRLAEATEERAKLAEEHAKRQAEAEAQAEYERDALAAREAASRYSDSDDDDDEDDDDDASAYPSSAAKA